MMLQTAGRRRFGAQACGVFELVPRIVTRLKAIETTRVVGDDSFIADDDDPLGIDTRRRSPSGDATGDALAIAVEANRAGAGGILFCPNDPDDAARPVAPGVTNFAGFGTMVV
jgi:hypothetical protein